MARLRLLHWKASEAVPVLETLRNAGHTIEYEEQFSASLLREWRKSPPDAFVIDLSRLPSHGKEVAIAVRQSPATRSVPIVFCQGESGKVASLRSLMPDAVYCGLPALAASLTAALQRPRPEAVVPVAMMDRYAERTTAQKLGLRPGSKLALLDPPPHFEKVLGVLPPETEFVECGADAGADVTLCFLHDPDSVRRTFSQMRQRAAKTKLWMLWRKKTSLSHSGVTEPAVRETGLSLGFVDYKICSVDKNWSGMLFSCKKQQRLPRES